MLTFPEAVHHAMDHRAFDLNKQKRRHIAALCAIGPFLFHVFLILA